MTAPLCPRTMGSRMPRRARKPHDRRALRVPTMPSGDCPRQDLRASTDSCTGGITLRVIQNPPPPRSRGAAHGAALGGKAPPLVSARALLAGEVAHHLRRPIAPPPVGELREVVAVLPDPLAVLEKLVADGLFRVGDRDREVGDVVDHVGGAMEPEELHVARLLEELGEWDLARAPRALHRLSIDLLGPGVQPLWGCGDPETRGGRLEGGLRRGPGSTPGRVPAGRARP